MPEIKLQGTPLSPGIALGKACFYWQAARHPDKVVGSTQDQATRLQNALAWMDQRLEMLAQKADARLDQETAAIFRMHRLMLESESLRQQFFEALTVAGVSAEQVIEDQLAPYQAQLLTADDSYLRERAADLAELKQGLLGCLQGMESWLRCKDSAACKPNQCLLGEAHILVAPELRLDLMIEVDQPTTKGFLVRQGGRNSHAAIVARALKIPAVSAIDNLNRLVALDATILIDGDSGEVTLNPSAGTLRRYRQKLKSARCPQAVIGPVSELKVLATIDHFADYRKALAVQADGIGLYRTEMEALREGRLLDEAEQKRHYRAIAKAMKDKPVYIRLLDFGADKSAPWLALPRGDNPALGCRGARLLLAHPEWLRAQARALSRVARRYPIHVVYPTIIDCEQYLSLRRLFDSLTTDLTPGRLLHGVMFEVPSACLQARRLFEIVDFGCIGTNDLVQYLFAVDRAHDDHNHLFDHPVLWSLLETLSNAAVAAGKPLSICGELTSNPNFMRRIIELGIKIVSTYSGCIGAVRRAVLTSPLPSRC